MKIEIENETNETINWSKQQILISKDKTVIVLSNGCFSNTSFEGYALNYGECLNKPHNSENWGKENFELYKGVLKLSNE